MTEPTTAITDYLLAAVSLCLGWSILRRDRLEPRMARCFWGWGLVALAFTALTGGSYHGFAGWMGEKEGAALWKSTVYLSGIVDLSMLCGSLMAALGGRWRRYALAAALAKFIVYAVWMTGHDEFRYVLYDYVPSMLAILLVHALPGSLRKEPGASWILAGVFLSFVAAGVQFFRLAPHARFNHNDLYHVIQIGATCLLYRGARDLRDR
ncbi:MAG TPA: hypothetical protein VGK94_13440 [Candidatus Polarisedimenticolia bacterium]|jgi:hypothetical protein